jgi:CelD/BcsL family acetyltransferase involved in cellulose biosynthesis
METRFLTLDKLDVRDEHAWRELVERSADPNPFFEPDFLLPAARHLGDRGAGLLVAGDSSEWHACLPVTSRATRLQVPVLAGWRTPYTFLGTPLVARGRERALPELLVEGMRGRLTGVAMLDQVPRASAAWAAFQDGIVRGDLVAVARRDFDRAAFRPDGPDDELPLSSRRRGDLRRTKRRLEERLGAEAEFVRLEPDDEVIRQFLEMEAAGWKGDAGTAVAAQEGHAQFFAELCKRFSASDRIEITAIRCAGRLLAMATMLAARDRRYAFKLAFDEEFRQQAPGTQLIANVAEHRDPDARLLDSCADPANDTLNRMWPAREELVSVVLARPGVRAGVLKRAVKAASRVSGGENDRLISAPA